MLRCRTCHRLEPACFDQHSKTLITRNQSVMPGKQPSSKHLRAAFIAAAALAWQLGVAQDAPAQAEAEALAAEQGEALEAVEQAPVEKPMSRGEIVALAGNCL